MWYEEELLRKYKKLLDDMFGFLDIQLDIAHREQLDYYIETYEELKKQEEEEKI